MKKMSGKQRQLLERDRLFMRAAWQLLVSEGYENFSIERVAELTGWSTRTVYLRFGSKLGLLMPLGLECRSLLVSVLSKAAKVPGCPRERLLGLGEGVLYYARNYPESTRVIRIIESETTLAPENDELLARFAEYDNEMFKLTWDIVEAGVAAGDLVVEQGDTVEGICFSFWTIINGAFGVLTGGAPLREMHSANPFEQVLRSGNRLADGYGWRPLTKEWDYAASYARIRAALGAAQAEADTKNAGKGFSLPVFRADTPPAALATLSE